MSSRVRDDSTSEAAKMDEIRVGAGGIYSCSCENALVGWVCEGLMPLMMENSGTQSSFLCLNLQRAAV